MVAGRPHSRPRAALTIFLVSVIGWIALPIRPSAAKSAASTIAPTHDQDYVARVFQVFLARQPTSSELGQATAISMTTVAGRSRLVGNLSQSEEWIRTSIDQLYVSTLDRHGDSAGLAYWVGLVRGRVLSLTDVAARFYSSTEYFTGRGGGSTIVWVQDLYQQLLGRSGAADPTGVAYWAGVADVRGRTDVAKALIDASESCLSRTNRLYLTFLGRSPDPAGLAYWAALLPRLGDQALAANLASSAEYYGPLQPGQVATPPPPPSLVEQLTRNGTTTKVITVRSTGWTSTTAEFVAWERTVVGWKAVAGPWTAGIGFNGFRKAIDRRESDGTTPTGRYGFASGFGLAANPGYRLGWFVVGPNDYWAEQPGRADYNTHQLGPANPAFAPWSNFEHLIDYPVAYRYAAVINFNIPVAGPYGSGIFLHVSTGGPTAGCVSLPESQLLTVLRWIDANTRIVMGPDSVIRGM